MYRHIILAYGKETEHKRAVFAILSFWAWYTGSYADVTTTVFTDRPEFLTPYLTGLPVNYVLLTVAQLEEMRGPRSFVHRIKVSVIAQVCESHPEDNVIFCDSDTFFTAKSDPLLRCMQAQTSIMHVSEYCFSASTEPQVTNNPIHPRNFLELIGTQSFLIKRQEQRFHASQLMWNSGVLGLAKEDTHLMSDIMALSDAFHAGSNWILSEQAAFSLALQTQTQILASSKQVFHYWQPPLKPLMDNLLATLVTKPFSEKMLTERLNRVRRLTTKWPRAIKLADLRGHALQAYARGDWNAAIKTTIKVWLASPFSAAFARDIASTFRRPSNYGHE